MSIIKELLRNLISKPATVNFPFETEGLNFPERLRGLHVIDQETCIGCRRCSRVCPSFVIEMVPLTEEERSKRDDKKKVKPKIDLLGCIFCGECEDICPKGSINLENKIVVPGGNPTAFQVQ